MKKIKLKKNIKKLLVIAIILLTLGTFATIKAIDIYKQKQYEKTYEYKLINIGYSNEETSKILNNFKNKEIEYILNNEKNDYYLNLVNEKYFIYDKFYDYLEYLKNNLEKPLTNIVEIVNTNTDKEYYTKTYETDTSKNELMLVNKYYYLDSSYEPDELICISTTYAWGETCSQKVNKVTYDAFMNLWSASHNEGHYLMVSSSFRTHEKQDAVYKDYQNKKGTEYADSIAARPGFSEHQTGYTLDMFEMGYTQKTFHTSESYNWLINNAHKYGFILRYPEDKEDITGYAFESWHYRYVGVSAATYIYENHITFDEYYAYFVK